MERSKASGTNLPISFKHAVEVGKSLNGMEVSKALALLNDAAGKKRAIPFRHYSRDVAHKKGMASGRYPVKACRAILQVLKNAAANASQNNIEVEKAKIVSFVCGRAVSDERHTGRGISKLTNVYIEVEG